MMKLSKALVMTLALIPLGFALAQDAIDAYSEARRALNRRDFDDAIAAFQGLRRDYPGSEYVGESYYWEAFALERNGNLERALDVIDVLLSEYPDADSAGDARALRIQVCADLARRGDTECAEAVSTTIRDPGQLDEATRMAAMNALLNMSADRAVPIAEQVATNRAQPLAIRKQALFVLADKADASRARDVLRAIALDMTDDREVRAQAVFWLSEVPGEETLDLLAEIAGSTSDGELANRAIFAISQHSDPRAWELLRDYAQNDALDTELRKQAIFWIGDEGGADALPFLVELYSSITNADLRRQVLFAVSETGSGDAKPWLLERARDTTEALDVRRQALFWAADVGVTAEELNGLYHSFDEPRLREHLIWLIAEEGGDDSVELLIDIARNDPDPEMRTKAIFWIGDSDDPRAAEYLLDLLQP
jgi:HEAT repeat protein